MIRHEVNFLAFQKPKGLCPDFVKRCIARNSAVRKESKDLTCSLQTLAPLNSVLIHTLFGNASCLTNISSDIIDKAVEQVIMNFLIAVIDKAQKVDMHNLFVKLAQPEDRIIGD